MSVSDGFNMKLPLRSDLNGNAFPVSSSSSSSSPESIRGLSGADGPPDYDLLEVTLTTMVTDADAVVISRWLPQDDDPEDDVSTGKTESNDNSVSVYLDADEFRRDAWNDNLTLSLTTSTGSHGNDDSLTPDSDATEVPADDDDDEEALFLSVCSSISEQNPVPPEETQSPPSEDLIESTQITLPAAPTKPAAKTKTTGANPAFSQRVSKLDLKTVRTRVGSRSNQSPPKPPSQQTRAAPVDTRRVVSRKQEAADGAKRPTAGPVRVSVVLRPVREKSSGYRTDRRAAASGSSLEDSPNRSVRQNQEAGGAGGALDAGGSGGSLEAGGAVDAGSSGDSGGSGGSLEAGDEALLTEAMMEKRRSHVRKVSSKPGPGPRQQQPPPPGPPGPPGQGSPGPRAAQNRGSSAGEGGQSAGSGSPSKPRQSQNQGIPKPRTSSFTAPSPASSTSRPTANQQPASGSSGRPAASSKLPVKGLPTSLSASSLGSNDSSRAAPSCPGAPGIRPEDRPSRGPLPLGIQSTVKPPSSSSTPPSPPSDAAPSSTSGGKLPPMRSRASSLQARASTTGLKPPNISSVKSPSRTPAVQNPTCPTQNLLQRSGSARRGRLVGSVDKNKQTSRCSQTVAGEQNQNQPLPPPEQVPDVLNANTPAAPVLPVPSADNTTSGSTGPSSFRARTGARSSPKAGSRLQYGPRPAGGAADGSVPGKQNHNKEQVEKKNQAINQLRRLLVQGNRRVEALATVIQHLFTEREEALKQKKELSLELSNLRDELASSSQCCERLQKEKEEARLGLEEALKRLEEQHKEELEQLEDRLRSFYQTEWDKVHQTYQEEADKCRMLMEQQVEGLRSRQEAERKNQEENHLQTLEALKQQYQSSIEELRRNQQMQVENLQKTLTETETSLSEKISELSAEKEDLSEKLAAEEERRKRILSDKNLKDSHTVYLEQELESLKVVLEIKNNQLHQKEKKLMEMDKLVESNVKLEECLKKVQQENEDYKARMDKHAALSKQLSTEQAILQQTLQKESKVNKRLSMENEELLWKLHNGDLLASPRRLSPTSPFGSPRNSTSFPTAAPLSPR
ncbi:microtubule-associated tumor suppressor 1 homolog isoform X1 [Amphiprion ocellaris]|uniref:Microtubule associated tumor suppressor 1b n=1 Tax=Amphiprion ocellaris TaxID=80972 RepID=A0AAQ5XP64_AMPOC|nr:microtubule-associated tumor suppressor 1 homolog isoform X1 [Amphiprion ocellaris]XP_054866066.1 microtubule-associated tumor suppressor 1 homolog isoform X1 [Amphiprion ocellaris]XP_054866067.1 microtubule-associated tumor suppressor 1 homolog isoform X1 [Amphiprion ocellaris]